MRVWAASATDAWAVGTGGVLRWDGTAWAAVTGLPSVSWDCVYGTSAQDVWLAGAGLVYRWNGTGFTMPGAPPEGATALWGSGANDVWATDTYGGVAHWNGAAWTQELVGNGGQPLYAIAGGPTRRWAVGTGVIVQK
ncbi:MAG: hypothetical protein IT380_30580 [Myxococcales bacterium]|nr:hypothetical protein [Myxococcales bacterium]